MKKLILLLSFVISTSLSAQAQIKNESFDKQVEAMKKFDFLVGRWKGSGWIVLGQNNRQTFTIDETLQSKLNGTIVVIEGVGKNAEKTIIHNAFAVISYNAEKQTCRWNAYTKDGFSMEATAEVSDKKIIWGFQSQFGQVRYTITLTEKGNWLEVGEFSRDGTNWFKNFEMELKKVK